MTKKTFDFQPVVIIGAARSGTNMLRDLLTKLEGVSTWPCDEINYIWRYGNAGFPTDELPAELARPQTKLYIRSQFAKMARVTSARWLVEKTCANSLRVEFVHQVIPEARYIFLVRNGLDAAASASKRWHAELDLSYLIKKARYVPLRDMSYYARRYFSHRVQRLVGGQKRLPTWGPRFTGMDRIVGHQSCIATCVHQWRESVNSASKSLARIAPANTYVLRYEDFVQSPASILLELCEKIRHSCTTTKST